MDFVPLVLQAGVDHIFKTKLFTLSLSKNVSRNPLTGFKNNIFTIFLPLPRRSGGIFLGSNSSSAQIFLSPGGGGGIFSDTLSDTLVCLYVKL